MENKNDTPPPPPLFDQLKEYADTQIKLAKYEAIDRSSKFMASIITDMIVAGIFLLTFLFLSFAIAFVLATWLFHSYAAGFGCMAAIYFVIAIIIILFRRKLQRPLINLFIRKFFNK